MTKEGRVIFGGEKNTLRLQQMHRDIVSQAPPNAEIIGSNDNCDCQAMYIPGRLLSVQGHPEFNKEIVEILLDARVSQGIITEQVHDEAFPRAKLDHDGLLVAQAAMRLIA